MKKTVLLNGLIVGEVEATGNFKEEAEAVRVFLDERGLRKEVSPFQATFNAAVAFANTSAYLYERDLRRIPRNGVSVVPFIVNAAFGIELYFKALAQKHDLTLTGHELIKLHQALPVQAHQEIQAVTSKCVSARQLNGEPDFPGYLHQLNKAFVEWRYFYEKERMEPVNVEHTIFVMQVLHEACCLPSHA